MPRIIELTEPGPDGIGEHIDLPEEYAFLDSGRVRVDLTDHRLEDLIARSGSLSCSEESCTDPHRIVEIVVKQCCGEETVLRMRQDDFLPFAIMAYQTAMDLDAATLLRLLDDHDSKVEVITKPPDEPDMRA